MHLQSWLEDLGREIRLGARSLRRAPGFVVVVLVCLGLGIGANGAIFTVVNAVLLRPLPYDEPDRLVNAYETFHWSGEDVTGSVSYPNYRDWIAQSHAFTSLAAGRRASAKLRGTEGAERVATYQATANYFTTLGVTPVRGRGFTPDDVRPGAADVVVMNERYWRARFGSDPGLLGRPVVLDGRERTVVGIIPGDISTSIDFWVPLLLDPALAEARDSHFLQVIGRLKPGVAVETADADLRGVAAAIRQDHPEVDPSRGARVRSVYDDTVGRARSTILIMLGAVGLVLLIACANVANLFLARAASRRHEFAVRLAIGASRRRLVRQLLVESLLLSLGGAVVGGGLAWLAIRALQPMVAGVVPRSSELQMDTTVFLYLLGAAVVSALLFGLVPALDATGGNIQGALTRAGARGASGGQRRMRSALVVAELALSLVLLTGAGLLVRGMVLLQREEIGFATDNVLTAHVTLPETAGPARGHFILSFLGQVRAIPGVRAAGLISHLPLQEWGSNGNFTVVGQPAPERGREPIAEYRITSPGLLEALEIPLLAGRGITERDVRDTARVLLINSALARRHFPGQDAVGRQLDFGDGELYRIVGVVGDTRQAGFDRAPMPEVHFPALEQGHAHDLTLVVRATVPPLTLTGAIRAALHQADAGQALYQVMTMEQVLDRSLRSQRLNLWLLAVFAGMAVVLASAGLFGVISFLVGQRTRELGIRKALGARHRDVVLLVLRQAGALVVVGLTTGLVGAFVFTRFLSAMLYGVTQRDPLTSVSVTVALGAVAMLAALIPARRAARVDPMLAIRAE